jgi:3-methyladenine DNA glycosylase AlkD
LRLEDVLQKLEKMSNPKAVESMARYGITPKRAYGISIPDLRKLAREIGKNHLLAQELWDIDTRETRILATMISEPEKVTEEQMENWVKDFDYWEICDQCCANLFTKTRFAYRKAVEWSSRDEEFVKRAGFVLMARLALADKKASDEIFEEFLLIIKREATDERHYVKKAVNWALRQIGKRNIYLNKKAIEVAKEIGRMDSKSARWIASDALRELTGEAVMERLIRKKEKDKLKTEQ